MDKILVLDDEKNLLKVIKMRLEANDYQVATALQAETAVEIAKKEEIDLALVDLKLAGKNGIEVMEELHQINPEMPIIILTAYGTIKSAVEAMKRGAYSYLTKPFDYRDLLLQIKNGLEKSRLSKEVLRLRNMVERRYGFKNVIGKSEKMKKVLARVGQAAESESSVYIEGETGTGKGLLAKTLHFASSRKNGPFIVINCATIPENLLESELFGYEKGAFTGATRSKKGLFLQAHKGTLFLDEISEMPIFMQAKLLQALESKEFYPLGGEKPVKVDARLIAASNKKMHEKVKKGDFREDLFYRIYVIPIEVPPLRERKGDIPLLAEHYLQKITKDNKKGIRGFSPSALQKLMLYSWPGNVRELENTIECAVAMATQDAITEDLILPAQTTEGDRLRPLKDAKEGFERNYVIQIMELTRGNISRAAKLAGKYRADFYDLLKKYDLNPQDFRKR
ncbi:MAG: sigma-54-dependent Fis family transcriptional regulator [Deltaproteobacteria bacterium]|nr:sigma-54-dependent Fis family transcriptional regulator [Deltaproteobacteria bacterium]MBW1794210.1 sigma-54-dependent Fis family transcriptional regulator [Deltaproteobacteria bacterium]MBW2331602.1 sigma-54-dependent Fis family transcriptional regulator [Deltaproteobacteria bacterium]